MFAVVHNHMLQLAQSVVANLGHSLERRLARWLAMLDDRSATDVLAVTHDQLAQLLNVRRATVTDALHVLEGEKLIRNTRGRVAVRDRAGLRARAMQSYGLSEDDYRATIGPLGKNSPSSGRQRQQREGREPMLAHVIVAEMRQRRRQMRVRRRRTRPRPPDAPAPSPAAIPRQHHAR